MRWRNQSHRRVIWSAAAIALSVLGCSTSDDAATGAGAGAGGVGAASSGAGGTAGSAGYEECTLVPASVRGTQESTSITHCVVPGDNNMRRAVRLDLGAGETCGVVTPCDHANCGPNNSDCCEPDCVMDSDCPAESVCLCETRSTSAQVAYASFMHTQGPNICVPTTCRDSADCGGLPCSLSIDGCRLPVEFRCHTPDDLCMSSADCEKGDCVWERSTGRWECDEGTGICETQ